MFLHQEAAKVSNSSKYGQVILLTNHSSNCALVPKICMDITSIFEIQILVMQDATPKLLCQHIKYS